MMEPDILVNFLTVCDMVRESKSGKILCYTKAIGFKIALTEGVD